MKAAVEMHDVLVTCTFVKVVNVLRDERHFREESRELRDGAMRRIRFARQRQTTAVFVPTPHDITLARERRRRGQFSRIVVRPKACRIVAKSGNAALLRYAGAGKYHNVLGFAETFD